MMRMVVMAMVSAIIVHLFLLVLLVCVLNEIRPNGSGGCSAQAAQQSSAGLFRCESRRSAADEGRAEAALSVGASIDSGAGVLLVIPWLLLAVWLLLLLVVLLRRRSGGVLLLVLGGVRLGVGGCAAVVVLWLLLLMRGVLVVLLLWGVLILFVCLYENLCESRERESLGICGFKAGGKRTRDEPVGGSFAAAAAGRIAAEEDNRCCCLRRRWRSSLGRTWWVAVVWWLVKRD